MVLSAGLALAFVWVGLGLAFYISYPASFFITAVAFATYLISVGWVGRPSHGHVRASTNNSSP
jgi:ABC-type Mn2+/Zn2+ transport system permease subunit